MLQHIRALLHGSIAVLILSAPALATDYYIDFAGGDDAADGQSPDAAWKHAPGDANATGKPAEAQLQPGDTLIFKGGVAYIGSIVVKASGEDGKPITLDGNTAGKFGQGRATLDGGRIIDNWQRVESQEQALGAEPWRQLFYADVDVDISSNANPTGFVLHRQVPRDKAAPWQRVILIDGDRRLLPIAQMPKPSDAFYPDIPGDFYQSPNKIESHGNGSAIVDEKNLTADDADHYEDMFVGVRGGNNHVYFGKVSGYDPQANRLVMPKFVHRIYDQTQYAFYNSPRLITQPGEWAIVPLDGGKARVFLLPDRLKDGQPDNVGYPDFATGVSIEDGASHIAVKGFLIQRYSGGAGGVSVARSGGRSKGIHIADNEIRFVAGHAGIGLNYCDDIVVERNHIHHCPGWTTAIFNNRINDFVVRDNRLVKNSGSGIRHYEAKRGKLIDNVILDHFGMHSSAINVYEGCEDMLIEGNYIQNVATINRNARNITFRNNVIDGMGRAAVTMAMWGSGRTGGRDLENIHFINNTFVRTNHSAGWSAGIFGQSSGSAPKGLVIRNNILDRIGGRLPGTIEDNIFTRQVDEKYRGQNGRVIMDDNDLYRNARKGDFRRRPGGLMMEAGADVAPPKFDTD